MGRPAAGAAVGVEKAAKIVFSVTDPTSLDTSPWTA